MGNNSTPKTKRLLIRAKKPSFTSLIGTARIKPLSKHGTVACLYALVLLLTAVFAVTLASARRDKKLDDPIPAAQSQAVSFQLYYPARLPDGLMVDAAQLRQVQTPIVNVRVTDGRGQGRAFTITEQPVVSDFNLETFYSSFTSRTSLQTKLGTATLGTIDDGKTRIASMVTDKKTWIFIQAPVAVSQNDLEYTLKHLQASQ